MKNNLTTRPSLVTEITQPNNVERHLVNGNKKMDRWFKRFEKELREDLLRLGAVRAGSIYTEDEEKGMMIQIRKILGEK